MLERWLVIGTDERMKMLAKYLSDDTRTVYYKCTNKWDATMNAVALEFQPQHVVLPIHPLYLEVTEVLGLNCATIYAGKLTDEWRKQLGQLTQHPYLEDERFIWQNAALTAEAMLAHFYKQGVSMKRKTILITGFGRVAKMLAQLFVKLDAHVVIAARSKVQIAEALAYGYEAQYLTPTLETKAECCINTIPAKWLNEQFESIIAIPIYDLASIPGCLDEIELSQYELLAALPGKYFPQEAAKLLVETTLQLSGRKYGA